MRTRRTISIGLIAATAVAGGGAIASAGTAKPKLVKIGSFAQVTGKLTDLHPGAGRAIRVSNGAVVDAGDVVTLQRGATARIALAGPVKGRTGTLVSFQAKGAHTIGLLAGAASDGRRAAVAYDGHRIALAAGSGLDAAVKLGPVRSSGATVTLSFSAPGDLKPTYRCSVDGRAFRTCTSPDRVRLRPGRHRVSIETTSVFSFHGPPTTHTFTVR